MLTISYDANIHTAPSPWGVFVVFVPVIGAVGVVYLVRNFAPEAKGHGVPEVMDAIYYNKGLIRPMVAVVKSLASALSIGSGGSVGREGPIAQIGSAFGSTLGQLLRVIPWQCNVLIAAGAGGGIAATLTADHTIHELIETIRNEPEIRWFLITDSEKLIGLLSREAVLEAAISKTNTEQVTTIPSLMYISVGEDNQFYSIIVRMRLTNAVAALVVRGETVSPGNVVGIISEEQIAKTVSEGAEFFPILTSIK